MKKYFIFTIFFLSLFSCNNQSNSEIVLEEKYTEIVNNKLVYEVINSVLSDKDNVYRYCDAVLNRKTVIFLNNDSTFIKKFDTIFSKNDKKYILKQYRNGNKFILNQKFIQNKKVIEFDTLTISSKERKAKFWEKVRKENNCVGYLYVPLFNLKKDLAIIECGDSGEGGTFIYRLNRNKKWELFKTIEKWIE
ncbi:MAG: hypothetical protein O9267_12125 [Flavobacterium sp.]|uniref:hypothetical protein n=1 Tax=Flavobacterium sp. TaxID=239 RepID=UPI0022BD9113|nr:hypothetical protein [Flavobacterium sp.]MCZ8198343.1 hypothetical protein [Flavobacterium sp.]